MTQDYDIHEASWNTYMALHAVLRDTSASTTDIGYAENLLTGLLHNNDFAGHIWSYAKDHVPEQFDNVRKDIGRAQSTPLDAQAYGGAQFFQSLLEDGKLDGLKVVEEPTNEQIAPVIEENVPVAEPTREDAIANLRMLQSQEGTIDIENFKPALVFLNSNYEQFFDAVQNSEFAGIAHNELERQVEKALNEDPAALEKLIEISANDEDIAALTRAIQTQTGADDFIYTLAQGRGEAPFTTNNMGAIPLDGPDIPSIDEIITSAPEAPKPDLNIDEVPDINPTIDTLPNTGPPMLSGMFGAAHAATPTDIQTESFQQPAEDNTKSNTATATEDFKSATNTNAAPTNLGSYEIQPGDDLWKIASEEYQLTNAIDIMRAVDHIAHANGLQNGTDANHIETGQTLRMPTAEQITKDVSSLNWAALDAETQENLRGGAPAMDSRMAAAPNFN